MAYEVAARVQLRCGGVESGNRVGHRVEPLVVDDDLGRGSPGDLGVVGGDEGYRLARRT